MNIIALGVFLVILPYLGIPGSWRTVLIVLSGLAVAAIGFLLRGETLSRGILPDPRHPFVENNAAPAQEHQDHEREGINSLN